MKKAISYLPYYVACIGLASALWRNPVVLLLGFIGLSVLMLLRWHALDDVVSFLVPFVLGPVGEFIAIYNGAWHYSKPLLLVPIWLPFAWGCASLYMKRTADVLAGRRVQRRESSDGLLAGPLLNEGWD